VLLQPRLPKSARGALLRTARRVPQLSIENHLLVANQPWTNPRRGRFIVYPIFYFFVRPGDLGRFDCEMSQPADSTELEDDMAERFLQIRLGAQVGL
jgi:hypothetical protein